MSKIDRIARCCAVIVFVWLVVSTAHAQGAGGSVAFSNIGTEEGKPFLAERVTTSMAIAADGSAPTVWTSKEYVARDSSGRVRIERLMQPVNPAATEAEIAAIRRVITISDARGAL
jgi:hypothetical protein